MQAQLTRLKHASASLFYEHCFRVPIGSRRLICTRSACPAQAWYCGPRVFLLGTTLPDEAGQWRAASLSSARQSADAQAMKGRRCALQICVRAPLVSSQGGCPQWSITAHRESAMHDRSISLGDPCLWVAPSTSGSVASSSLSHQCRGLGIAPDSAP